MPITKSISSRANTKQATTGDFPLIPAQLVTSTYGPATSTASQTVINLGFAVPTANTANFILSIDGKILSLGASNDYTFTNLQSNGTSSQVTLNFSLAANLNIYAIYFGVAQPPVAATSIATVQATIALQPTISIVTTTSHSGGFSANTSGTYTTPAGVKYIRVRAVGGGGGGQGQTGAGGGGTSTTFGPITCNGGSGGSSSNSTAGGSASLGSGPVGLAIQGGYGSAGFPGSASSVFSGGTGGVSPFGGAGGSGLAQNGFSAVANTGSGGGGYSGSSGNGAGSGGAAGGYVDAIITSPSATYSYGVGSGGTAGTGTFTGGTGGTGIVIVEEFYV